MFFFLFYHFQQNFSIEIFPEFAIFFLLAVLLPFRMALHRYKKS